LADRDLTGDFERRREQILTQWRNAAERQLEEELAHVDRRALPRKVTTTVIGARHAARALLDAAERARLLVIGRRGRGGFAGMVLGSVSQQCVRHATSPVMVVPITG
jgi:nucleotide-binding universal stress UspA family protein